MHGALRGACKPWVSLGTWRALGLLEPSSSWARAAAARHSTELGCEAVLLHLHHLLSFFQLPYGSDGIWVFLKVFDRVSLWLHSTSVCQGLAESCSPHPSKPCRPRV